MIAFKVIFSIISITILICNFWIIKSLEEELSKYNLSEDLLFIIRRAVVACVILSGLFGVAAISLAL